MAIFSVPSPPRACMRGEMPWSGRVLFSAVSWIARLT